MYNVSDAVNDSDSGSDPLYSKSASALALPRVSSSSNDEAKTNDTPGTFLPSTTQIAALNSSGEYVGVITYSGTSCPPTPQPCPVPPPARSPSPGFHRPSPPATAPTPFSSLHAAASSHTPTTCFSREPSPPPAPAACKTTGTTRTAPCDCLHPGTADAPRQLLPTHEYRVRPIPRCRLFPTPRKRPRHLAHMRAKRCRRADFARPHTLKNRLPPTVQHHWHAPTKYQGAKKIVPSVPTRSQPPNIKSITRPLLTGLVQPWVQSEGSCLASATPFTVRILFFRREITQNLPSQ